MNRRTFAKSILTGIGAILSSKLLGNGLAPVEKVSALKTPANDYSGYALMRPSSDSRNIAIPNGSYAICIGQGTPVYSVSNFVE